MWMGRSNLRLVGFAVIHGLNLMICGAVPGVERDVKLRIRNASSTPVFVKASTIQLIEKYVALSQSGISRDQVEWTRVRYANRKGRTVSQLFLEGKTTLVNRSNQPIEFVGLGVMPHDAFNQPIETQGVGHYKLHQVQERIPQGASTVITWEQPVDVSSVYEVAVSVIAVRFADGAVWSAPKDFIQETFFPTPK
jgi:hypothetical protein